MSKSSVLHQLLARLNITHQGTVLWPELKLHNRQVRQKWHWQQ